MADRTTPATGARLTLAFAVILALGIASALPSDAAAAFPGDNGRIAWTTFSPSSSATKEIVAMDPDGTDREQLTDNAVADQEPSISPDGERIAFATNRDGDFEIYVMDADGGNPINVTDHAAANDLSPQFSPDGDRIAFVRGSINGSFTLYVMNADGSDRTPLAASSTAEL